MFCVGRVRQFVTGHSGGPLPNGRPFWDDLGFVIRTDGWLNDHRDGTAPPKKSLIWFLVIYGLPLCTRVMYNFF